MNKSSSSKSKLTVLDIGLQMWYEEKFYLSCLTVAVNIIITNSINFQLFVAYNFIFISFIVFHKSIIVYRHTGCWTSQDSKYSLVKHKYYALHIDIDTYFEHAITTFEMSVRQAAISAIPVQTVKQNHLTLPPKLCSLLKLKNHYRRRYQRSRLPMHHHLYQLFSQVFSTQLSRLRNTKWTSFLRTLHPQSSQFWKIACYFTNPTSSLPPDPTWDASLPYPT